VTSSDDVSDLSRKIFNQRKYLLNLHASNPDARPVPVISDIRQEGKYSGQNIKRRIKIDGLFNIQHQDD